MTSTDVVEIQQEYLRRGSEGRHEIVALTDEELAAVDGEEERRPALLVRRPDAPTIASSLARSRRAGWLHAAGRWPTPMPPESPTSTCTPPGPCWLC